MRVSVSRLHLLIPGLLGPLPNLQASGVVPSVPLLEKLLRRADRSASPGEDFLTTLFSLFGITRSEQADLPEAAVNYFAHSGEAQDGCWVRADPVHLRPDRDRLLLFNSEPLDITEAEAQQIAGRFNEHFAADDLTLLTTDPEHWYLRLEQCPELKTHTLNQVVGHHIEPFMPKGKDAGQWRRLMNEMQMLLFQTPVNQLREAEGRLSINGIWLSGIGRLPEVNQCRFASVHSDDPTAVGLARLSRVPAQPVDAAALAWSAGDEILMVLTDLLSPVLNVDPYRWSENVQLLENRIGSLIEQLRREKKREWVLYPCNGEKYAITAGALRRFWRRNKSITTLVT
ncbi:MAG: hypothetical protein QNJ78_15600 [Gammaproteobacteria bacterium]|nr:hypothetical protein [Gammaproteobacteria bacterium]